MLAIAAGVVLFNPDPDRLRENLKVLLAEVDLVHVIDNASSDSAQIDRLIQEFPGITITRNSTNRGISVALNQIMNWAAGVGVHWALLLDQDSVFAPGFAVKLSSHVRDGVGVVVPSIRDRNVGRIVDSASISEIDFAITSGSLCRLAAWRESGAYDEEMFIDFVDFDFCLRLRSAGYRIVRDSSAVLHHEIGNSRRYGPFIAYNHSAFRSYHMARDMLYYVRKHKYSPRELMVQKRGRLGTYLILLRKIAIVMAFESDKSRRVMALLRGTTAGTLVRVPVWRS